MDSPSGILHMHTLRNEPITMPGINISKKCIAASFSVLECLMVVVFSLVLIRHRHLLVVQVRLLFHHLLIS